MSRHLRILTRAERDRDQIFAWLAKRSPRGASAWYDAFSDRVDQIAENPDSYSVAGDALPRWGRDIRHAFFKTRRGRRYRQHHLRPPWMIRQHQ